jgi:hypothetical protein
MQMSGEWISQVIEAAVAIGTGSLAWSTWQMSKASNAMLAVESEPYLSLASMEIGAGMDARVNPPVPCLSVTLILRNPGKVRTNVLVQSMMVSLQGVQQPQSHIAGNRLVIHPGEPIEFSCWPIHTTQQSNVVTNVGTTFSAEFWADGGRRHTVSFEVSAPTTGLPGPGKWRYVKGPDYT